MQTNNLYLFNIRDRKSEKVEIEPLLDKNVIEFIEEGYAKIGLKIEICFIQESEQLVKKYFEYKGYKVLKTNPLNKNGGEFLIYCNDSKNDGELIIKYLEDNFKFYDKEEGMNLQRYLGKSGIPDFLVYRKEHKEIIQELFFVEVKNWVDGLNGNQLLWIFQNNVPTKIAYLD